MSDSAIDGHIRLFNKNAGTTLQVRVVAQAPDRFGHIVECDEVPEYFRAVLHPEDDTPPRGGGQH